MRCCEIGEEGKLSKQLTMLISSITLPLLGMGHCVSAIRVEVFAQSSRSPSPTQVLQSEQSDTEHQLGPSFKTTHLVIKGSSAWRGASWADSYIAAPKNPAQNTISGIRSEDILPSKIRSSQIVTAYLCPSSEVPKTAGTGSRSEESSYLRDSSRLDDETISSPLSPYNSPEYLSASTHPRSNSPGIIRTGDHPDLGASSPILSSGELSTALVPESMTPTTPCPLIFEEGPEGEVSGGQRADLSETDGHSPPRSGNTVALASSLTPHVSGPKINKDAIGGLTETAISLDNMARPVVFHTDVRPTSTTGGAGALNSLVLASITTDRVGASRGTTSGITRSNTISEGIASISSVDGSSTVASTSAITPPKGSTSHNDPRLARILIPVGVVTSGVCMFFVTFACARHYNKHSTVQNK